MMRKQYALSRSDDVVPSTTGEEGLAAVDIDEKTECSNDSKLSAFTIQVTAMASLGGILFGYDLGVISGALPWLTLDFDLSVRQQELVVSILYVGGGVGAMVGGSICDTFGRKRAIIVTDVCFLIGALILCLAPSFSYVILGRLVVGFAVAVSGIADVSYLHEIAPVQWRGSIVSVNEACISLGFLLAFVAGIAFSGESNTSAWRSMFGASGIIALIQMIGMARMPESPLWLQGQGRLEDSRVAMQRIRGHALPSDMAENEEPQHDEPYDSLADDIVNANVIYGANSEGRRKCYCKRMSMYCHQCCFLIQQQISFWKEIYSNYRRQAIIAAFLAVTQQFCGQTNVLNYAPLILAGASGDAESTTVRHWASLSIGLVKFVTTVIVVWKIEALGRRFLLLSGMAVIAVGMLLLIISFETTHLQDILVTDEEALSEIDRGLGWIIPGVLLVVTGYSLSFGTLTWLLTSELFPTEIRGRALGASTIVTYACATLVTSTFISAQAWLGRPSLVFLVYFLVTCIGFVFAALAVPDTKEKSTVEIETSLDGMSWWKSRRRIDANPTDSTQLDCEMTLAIDKQIS